MKLDVPFYMQASQKDCGPTTLQMVLEYLSNTPYDREELQKLVDSERSGFTWTLGLAKATAQLGFPTEFYTTCLGFNPRNYKLEFYRKETDSASSSEQRLERLKREAVQYNVAMTERSLALEEILAKLSGDCVPILILDWSKIKGSGRFIGHFVPIVGYDDEHVYVHNQGLLKPGPFIAIKKDLFEAARKATGTDEDILFVHRKRNV